MLRSSLTDVSSSAAMTEEASELMAPYQADEGSRYFFSQEQIDQFWKDGYIVVRGVFSSEITDAIRDKTMALVKVAKSIGREEIQRLQDEEREIPKDFRCPFPKEDDLSYASILFVSKKEEDPAIKLISWAGGADPDLLAWGRDPAITGRIRQLLGTAQADHLINQLHPKVGGDKVEFTLHQDIQFRRLYDENWSDVNGRGSFVQTLTAIDPTPEESGPLVVIPGSHVEDLFLDELSSPEEQRKKIEGRWGVNKTIPLILESGDIMYMHPLLVHGSSPNTSGQSRILFVNGFSCPGANTREYPGKGSAQTINLPALP